MACETLLWPRTPTSQCAAFLPMDPSLRTLDLAEAACGANPECGGVSDLYCNGIHPGFANDHYALCNGTATVPASYTCTFAKTPYPPPSPPPPDMPPPASPPSPPSPPPPDINQIVIAAQEAAAQTTSAVLVVAVVALIIAVVGVATLVYCFMKRGAPAKATLASPVPVEMMPVSTTAAPATEAAGDSKI